MHRVSGTHTYRFAVTVDPFLAATSLRFPPGGPATDAVTAVLGLTPPTRPNTWVGGAVRARVGGAVGARGGGAVGAVVWLGPDEWLVVSGLAAPETQEAELRAAVVPFGGAAVDVSGQRVSLTLRGRHVRDVLTKGCALDLHPSMFGSGSSAQTTLGRAGVVVLAGNEPDEFTVLVRQSFASYLADWLVDAVEEFRPTP